jgi:hypothetical protein
MPVPLEALRKALSKILAAIEGTGHRAVAIGAAARRAWGAAQEPDGIELLTSPGAVQRDALLGAARGEGFRQDPQGPLRLVYDDSRAGTTVTVDLLEAETPFHARIVERAQPGVVLQTPMKVATCEDLILLSADPAVLVDLLRMNAGRIDGAYLRHEAEAAGTFDRLKSAWQAAKAQG